MANIFNDPLEPNLEKVQLALVVLIPHFLATRRKPTESLVLVNFIIESQFHM